MSLEKLFTKKHEVEYNGVKIEISDVTLKEAPIIARIISKTTGKNKIDVATAVSENLEDVKKVICSLTQITEDQIDQVSIDAILFIVAKIIKHNISYLKKTILPMAREIEKEMKTDGLKQSKS